MRIFIWRIPSILATPRDSIGAMASRAAPGRVQSPFQNYSSEVLVAVEEPSSVSWCREVGRIVWEALTGLDAIGADPCSQSAGRYRARGVYPVFKAMSRWASSVASASSHCRNRAIFGVLAAAFGQTIQ